MTDPWKNGADRACKTLLTDLAAHPEHGVTAWAGPGCLGTWRRSRQALAPLRVAVWTGRLPRA